jgi:hypothetical protein
MVKRSPSIQLNSRDMEIVKALALRVRLFSLQQIVDAYFGGDEKSARRRLNSLAAASYLVRLQVLARETPQLKEPMFIWAPNQPQPYFQSLVAKLRKRWLSASTQTTTVYLSGTAAAHLYGTKAPGKLRHTFQASHDLGFAETFLVFVQTRPAEAMAWIKEDIPSKAKGQIPDGLILDSTGTPIRAIEYCGLYPAKRLKQFHIHCAKTRLPYELW